MTDTKTVLSEMVIARSNTAGAELTDEDYWKRFATTAIEIAAQSIDEMRVDLGLVVHQATVGPLTKDGYKNALEQTREIAQRSLDRHDQKRV